MKPLFCIDELGAHPGATTDAGVVGEVIPATIGRIGIYNYILDGKPTRVLRTEEDVFAPESLKSLEHCTVTVFHPGESEVTPDNYRNVNVGFTREPVRDGRFLKANLIVQDGATLKDIHRPPTDPQRLCEVSAGYYMDFAVDANGAYESGNDPVFGPYDRRHTNIRYNHVSIGPKGWGRAGPDVRLQLDGNDDRYIRGMNVLVNDSATPNTPATGTPATPAAVVTPAPAVVDAAQYAPRADLDRANARADVLEAQVKELTAQLSVKTNAPVVDAAQVAARASLISDAKIIAPKFAVTDSMSDNDVRVGALKASGFEPKSTTPDYLALAFEMRVDARKTVVDSHQTAVTVIQSQTVTDEATNDANDPLVQAQERSLKRSLGQS